MPLTHIQLRPKERKVKPVIAEKKPALARMLGEPSPGLAPITPYKAPLTTPPPRAPLARALGAPTPAPDWQAEAWARRKEIVEENQAKLDAQADALYNAAQGLSKKDQDYILSKVVSKAKPGGLAAALGAEPGAISPAAVRTDPLMQTLIDKHYIRLDENGQTYSWMLPEKVKDTAFRDTRTVDGWLYEDITYKDGSTESRLVGRAEVEAPEAPSLSEQVSLARLQFDIEKYGQENVETAMKQLGDAPILGGTMRAPGTSNYRKVKQEDVDAYYNALQELSNYMRINKSGPQTVDDVAALYKNNPDAIKTVQAQFGLEPTGLWSPELAQALTDTFFAKGE